MDAGRVVQALPLRIEATHRGSVQGSPWFWESFASIPTERTMTSHMSTLTQTLLAYNQKAIVPLSYPATAVDEYWQDTLSSDVKVLTEHINNAYLNRTHVNLAHGIQKVGQMKGLGVLPVGNERSWLNTAPAYINACAHFVEQKTHKDPSTVLYKLPHLLMQYRSMGDA